MPKQGGEQTHGWGKGGTSGTASSALVVLRGKCPRRQRSSGSGAAASGQRPETPLVSTVGATAGRGRGEQRCVGSTAARSERWAVSWRPVLPLALRDRARSFVLTSCHFACRSHHLLQAEQSKAIQRLHRQEARIALLRTAAGFTTFEWLALTTVRRVERIASHT